MAEKGKKKKGGGDTCHMIIEISDHKMEYHDHFSKLVGAALDKMDATY